MATLQNLNFVPTSISGCQLWLDAADFSSFTLSGTNVTQWRDKSGNSRNLSAYLTNTSPSLVTNSLNGLAGVRYDGATNATSLSSAMPVPTVFFAVGLQTSGPANFLTGIPSDNAGHGPYYASFNSDVEFGVVNTSGTLFQADIATASNNTPYVLTGIYTGTSVSAVFNGGTSSNSVSFTGTPKTPTATIFGANWFNGSIVGRWPGTLNEIIAFTTTLTGLQRQQVEGYLAWKWGLQGSLPSTHPFKNIAPNSAGLAYPSALSIPVPVQSFSLSSTPIQLNFGFLPSGISGCQLWLDGTDVNGNKSTVANGATVTRWTDKSGSGNNATTTVGTITYSASSNALVFTGTQSMDTSLSCFMTTQSVFLVGTVTSSSVLDFVSVNGQLTSGIVSVINNYVQGLFRGGGPLITLGGTITSNATFLYNYTFNSGGTSLLFLNGSQTGSNASSTTLSGSGTVRIGSYQISGGGSGEYYIGTMNEIIIYNVVLSTAQRQQVEGYLAWKWGLAASLPSNHPYRYLIPGVPTSLPVPLYALQPASFRPTQISGLALWLDGQDPFNNGTVPANGTSVTTWSDKSGNGRNFTNAATAATFNTSENALSFNGTNRYTSTYTANITNETMFFVLNTSTQPSFPIASSASGGRQIGIYSATQVGMVNAGITWAAITSGISLNTRFFGTSIVTGGSNTQIAVYGSTSFAVANITAFSAGNTQLGVEVTSTGPYSGFIHEVIAYSSVLSTSQRQSVEGYLAWKWNMVGNLPANHPFKRFPPPPS